MANVIPAAIPKSGHPADDVTNRTPTVVADADDTADDNVDNVAARFAVIIDATPAAVALRAYPVTESDPVKAYAGRTTR